MFCQGQHFNPSHTIISRSINYLYLLELPIYEKLNERKNEDNNDEGNSDKFVKERPYFQLMNRFEPIMLKNYLLLLPKLPRIFTHYSYFVPISPIIKAGTHGQRPHAPGFLKFIGFARQYVCLSVCLSVCPPPRLLITSGVIWCDIDRV